MSDSDSVELWEARYQSGLGQRYPWDHVVSFVFRFAPREIDRANLEVLELGCGSGANLWFAAREGFRVTGIDASASAIAQANRRFESEGLQGRFMVEKFAELSVDDESIDLGIDRASITCVGYRAARVAIAQVRRSLRFGGHFLFNPYSSLHSSANSGVAGDDHVRQEIDAGSLQGYGQICFWDERMIDEVFCDGWEVVSQTHLSLQESVGERQGLHAEWRVVARKI